MAVSRSSLDPTRDTASILRRIGVLGLMVALPLSAPLFRIGPVVTYAVACVLLVAAAALDVSPRQWREGALRIARSTVFVAVAVAVTWALLSLSWTPVRAWRPAFGLGAILLLGLAAIVALPERMRASNLYPIPVGAGALAVVAIGLGAGFWGEGSEERVRFLERTLAVLVLFTWPGIAWLRSRGRDLEALALAVGTALAAAIGPGQVPLLALALGSLAHLAVQLRPRLATVIGIVLATILVAAPLLLAVAPRLSLSVQWSDQLALWHRLLLEDPARLLTGHGLGALRESPAAYAPVGAPILALWYEFGLVGVAAMAVAIAAALSRAPSVFGPLAPSVAGAMATASWLGASGIGGGALWWPVTLATVTLLFAAARRGQFRTRRPRALSDFMARTGAR